MFGFDADYTLNDKAVYWLEPIIIQWLKINRDYLEDFDFEDSLYWYNERANVSALAGAVWRCSGFALEEFSSEKGSDDEKTYGRVDLYFSLADNDAVIEAKIHWLYMHNKQDVDYIEMISETHNKAKDDILRTMKQEPANQGIALTFILPYWKAGEDTEFHIQKLRKTILESKSSFSAWFQNKTGKHLKNEKGNVFDCVAILGDLA